MESTLRHWRRTLSLSKTQRSSPRRKRRKIINATLLWLAARPKYEEWPLRFDVVTLDATGHVEWLQEAFDADD